MLSFWNKGEMEPYLQGRKGYVFRKEDGSPEDVWLHFDFRGVTDNITCGHLIGREIYCRQLTAGNMRCYNLTAEKIHARNIEYFALCVAYKEFTCRSAKGTRENARHFCLDKEIEYLTEGE